jgi:hypothetical protein
MADKKQRIQFNHMDTAVHALSASAGITHGNTRLGTPVGADDFPWTRAMLYELAVCLNNEQLSPEQAQAAYKEIWAEFIKEYSSASEELTQLWQAGYKHATRSSLDFRAMPFEPYAAVIKGVMFSLLVQDMLHKFDVDETDDVDNTKKQLNADNRKKLANTIGFKNLINFSIDKLLTDKKKDLFTKEMLIALWGRIKAHGRYIGPAIGIVIGTGYLLNVMSLWQRFAMRELRISLTSIALPDYTSYLDRNTARLLTAERANILRSLGDSLLCVSGQNYTILDRNLNINSTFVFPTQSTSLTRFLTFWEGIGNISSLFNPPILANNPFFSTLLAQGFNECAIFNNVPFTNNNGTISYDVVTQSPNPVSFIISDPRQSQAPSFEASVFLWMGIGFLVMGVLVGMAMFIVPRILFRSNEPRPVIQNATPQNTNPEDFLKQCATEHPLLFNFDPDSNDTKELEPVVVETENHVPQGLGLRRILCNLWPHSSRQTGLTEPLLPRHVALTEIVIATPPDPQLNRPALAEFT